MIPIKIYENSRRKKEPLDEEMNGKAFRDKLDLVEECRSGAALLEASLKHKIVLRYDLKVIKREYEVRSLVLKRNHKDSRKGKLAAN